MVHLDKWNKGCLCPGSAIWLSAPLTCFDRDLSPQGQHTALESTTATLNSLRNRAWYGKQTNKPGCVSFNEGRVSDDLDATHTQHNTALRHKSLLAVERTSSIFFFVVVVVVYICYHAKVQPCVVSRKGTIGIANVQANKANHKGHLFSFFIHGWRGHVAASY